MTNLKPYQLEGAQKIFHFKGRALLADDMGLGKTIQALYWIVKTPKRRPVVIVCPAGLRWTWQAEAALHFNLRVEVLEGRNPPRHMNRLPGDIVAIGYDILPGWVKLLRKCKPSIVVFDEVHYVKSHTAQRSRAAKKIIKGASSVVGLSGTPLTNRPIELWSVLHLIRPDIYPDRNAFAWKFCAPRYTPWGWKFDGAERTGELHRVLKQECMIRRLKKDVLKDLPDKLRKVIALKLPSYEEYEKAQDDFLHWLRTVSPSRATKAKKSQALVKVGYLLRLVAQLKMEMVKDWMREFFKEHPKEKLMALTMHRAVIDALHEAFPGSVIVDGRITGKKRAETVKVFQNNPKCQLLLGNWRAAGIGITLTSACYGVALDMPWTPGDLLQGEDRLHRIGQKRSVLVFYLIALDTIEEKLMRILLRKSKVLDAVLNGRENTKREINILDELLREFTSI